MKKTAAFIFLCALLVSCSVQKRKYQKGYYVNWHKSVTPREKKEPVPTARETKAAVVSVSLNADVEVPEKSIVADGNNSLHPAVLKKQKISFRAEPDSCDEITFRSGDVTKVKITEITPTELKYRRCDMAEGPLYVIKKADVFMVKYMNGTKEVFPLETNAIRKSNDAQDPYQKQRRHPDAALVLILSLTGIFFYYGSIHAIVLGSRTLREIRAQPDKYTGEDMVKLGIGLGILKLLLIVLLIAFLILLV